jgi:hypothetical protein
MIDLTDGKFSQALSVYHVCIKIVSIEGSHSFYYDSSVQAYQPKTALDLYRLKNRLIKHLTDFQFASMKTYAFNIISINKV